MNRRNLIAGRVEEFENNRFVHAELKRTSRYMEDVNPPLERSTKESRSCDECGRGCFSWTGLLGHKRRHGNTAISQYVTQQNFWCSVCDKICRSASRLNRLHKTKHLNHQAAVNKLACTQCRMACKSLMILMSHLRRWQRLVNLSEIILWAL